jgi:glycosyltransferase involved in cell wall biosynthesis
MISTKDILVRENMSELVSIIIPTFKRTKFLKNAIRSALEQTYNDIEVIIVDNNPIESKEHKETKIIVNSFSDKRVKYYLSNIPGNGASARNLGVKKSSGKYIAFLDDDDTFLSNKIEKQIVTLKANVNSEVCICGFARVKKDNKRVEYNISNLNRVYIKSLAMDIDLCAGSTMVMSRNVFLEVGGFDESFTRHQDIELLIRLLEKTGICSTNECLVDIMEHPLSNHPNKLEEIIFNRNKFIVKFRNVIDHLDTQSRNEIYYHQNLYLTIQCIKYFRPILALYYYLKSKYLIKGLLVVIKELKNQIRKRVGI